MNMTDATEHAGGCHCGAVRYEVETDLKQVFSCICSICTKHGLILTFVPRSSFHLSSGQERLMEYRFNKHVIQHLFCDRCGVESFAYGTAPDGSEMAAINVRCLDGVDVAALQPTPFNGRDR
jgi:hypothetical protein